MADRALRGVGLGSKTFEDEQGAVQARLNDPATYKDAPQEIPALNTRLQALEAEIEAAMLRWEELESRSGKK